MSTVTNTQLAIFLRKGSLDNPYVFIEETNRRISDGGKIVLQEFPINQAGYIQGEEGISDPVAITVILTIDEVDITFTEIKDPSLSLGAEQFRVDYEMGLLEFNPELYGAEVVKTISYVGRGAYYISASRIMTDDTYLDDSFANELPTTLQEL